MAILWKALIIGKKKQPGAEYARWLLTV